jgi:hypothetical protein
MLPPWEDKPTVSGNWKGTNSYGQVLSRSSKQNILEEREINCEKHALSNADILSAKLIKFTDNWRADFLVDS